MRKRIFISLILLSCCFFINAQDDSRDLLEAIKFDAYEEAIILINRGANVNVCDENGASALMWAAFKSDILMVKLLVTHGADVKKKGLIYLDDSSSLYYGSPFCAASAEGKLDVVRFLHEECRIPIDDRELQSKELKENGRTALQWACSQTKPFGISEFSFSNNLEDDFAKKNTDVIRYLLQENADINFNKTIDQNTPLLLSLSSNKTDVSKILIEDSADVRIKNSDGNTALHLAVMKSNLRIIFDIVRRHFAIDVNLQNNDGNTPALLCVKDSISDDWTKVICLRLLYTLGSSFEIKNRNNESVKSLARRYCDSSALFKYVNSPVYDYSVLYLQNRIDEIYSYIKSENYCSNQKYIYSYTLLNIAAELDNSEVIEILLTKGDSIDASGASGMTALMSAAQRCCLDAIKTLINHGAKVNVKANDNQDNIHSGKSALHFAAENGCLISAKYLIEHGANINELTNDKWSPIMLAAESGNSKLVKFFVYMNADLSLKNEGNETVLEIVKRLHNIELAKFLINPQFSLSDYINFSLQEKVEEYISSSRNLNLPDENNWYPIHYVVVNGDVKMVKLLLDQGVKADVLNDEGYTPLMIAAYNNFTNIVKLLVYNNANQMLKNTEGKTALEIAIERNSNESSQFLQNPFITPMDLLDLGYTEAVKEIIKEKDLDLDKLYDDGTTLLQSAAFFGQKELVEEIIEKGADVNIVSKIGATAISYAIDKGYIDIVNILIDKSNLELSTVDGWCPIHFAARKGDVKMVKLLLDHGVKTDVLTDKGFTPLMIAAYNNFTNIVKLLVYNNANQMLKNTEGKTALEIAIERNSNESSQFLQDPSITPMDLLELGYTEAVRKIIKEKDFDLDKLYDDGTTLLQSAAFFGQKELAEEIIGRGANVNIVSKIGATAISYAIDKGYIDIANILIDKSNLELSTVDGWCPIHYAARKGDVKMVKLLLDHGVKTDVLTDNGFTPLMIAAYYNFTNIVKLLVYNNGNQMLKNTEGKTALEIAIERNSNESSQFLQDPSITPMDLLELGYTEAVRKIIKEKDLDLDKLYDDGTTLLQTAAYYGLVEIVEVLLSNGADVNKYDKNGHTAIIYAIINEQEKTMNMLIDQTNLEIASNNGWLPIHFAAKQGNVLVLKHLIDYGVKLDVQTIDGETPLMIAAKYNNVDNVKLLVYNQANQTLKNKDGKTAWDFAISSNAYTVIDFLNSPDLTLFDLVSIGYVKLVANQIKANSIDANVKDSDNFSLLLYVLFHLSNPYLKYSIEGDTTAEKEYSDLLKDILDMSVYNINVDSGFFPAYNRGLRGEYIVLEWEDYEIGGDIELFFYYRSIVDRPKKLVLYKDGKVECFSFDSGRVGVHINAQIISKDKKHEIIKSFINWKLTNK